MERNVNPKTNRIILTGRDPTLLEANSKDNAVTVQNIATKSAANSPEWELIIFSRQI